MTNDLAGSTKHALRSFAGLRVLTVTGFEPAVALDAQQDSLFRRRFTMLFADESSARRGGLGQVVRATNVEGETFAVKTMIAADDTVDVEQLAAAFRQEYDAHKALSGFKGFPRLYGWGQIDGAPAIIMEWVEGETLADARYRLAVDDDGRLSPLTAARIGRDLFGLLVRMGYVDGGFVHRDISPANIMIRTSHLSVEQQAQEGSFDLCLIDFGSSRPLCEKDDSFTRRTARVRHATVAYAPPEMLSDDLPNLLELRQSPAIDVYAAASTVFELTAGKAPFADRLDGAASSYRVKMDEQPAELVGVHATATDMAELLVHEPEVAVAAVQVAQSLAVDPDDPLFRDALSFVDEQLGVILSSCLRPDQAARPTAAAVHRGLEAFCARYAENVRRSLRGEELLPCPMDTSWLDGVDGLSRDRAGRLALVGAAALAGGLVAVSCAALLDGIRAHWSLASFSWQGRICGAVILCLLAAIPVVGYAVRRMGSRKPRGLFLRGSLGVVTMTVIAAVLFSYIEFARPGLAFSLAAATLVVFACSWVPMALAYRSAPTCWRCPRRLPAPQGPSHGILNASDSSTRSLPSEGGRFHGQS